MRKSIKTALATCVRIVIPLIKLAEKYYMNKKDGPEKGIEPSLLFLFDSGYSTTISGWGNVFNEFCKTKHLGNYTGRNVKPRKPEDEDYTKSRLCILPFDHAFNLVPKSIVDRKFVEIVLYKWNIYGQIVISISFRQDTPLPVLSVHAPKVSDFVQIHFFSQSYNPEWHTVVGVRPPRTHSYNRQT